MLTRGAKIARYLETRDNRLMAQDGDCRDTLEGCEKALRDVYLIATTGSPNPSPEPSHES
jgi:hypothetical protein